MKRGWAGALLLFVACGSENEQLDPQPVVEMNEPDEQPHRIEPNATLDAPADVTREVEVATPPPRVADGPIGFIGSPCASARDCTYDGSVCLRDGFPRGMCSLSCDRLCPDRADNPVTFCADQSELPRAAYELDGAGACLPRCDFALFPGVGCRDGYGCTDVPRAGELDTRRMACLPGAETMISPCLMELAAMGVDFEPTVVADDHPADHPELTCHVEDPVRVRSPVHGVALEYYDGSPTATVLAACNMAKQMVRTIDDVAAAGVRTLRHYGSYNCRVIAGTDHLSRHGMGDALDIAALVLDDGTVYTVLDDFEMNDDTPEAPGGIFLYDAVHRWHDGHLWNIILTPNYNDAHRDHFHVDLTPGSNVLHELGVWYLGPGAHED